jgi:hypothetical protein
VDKLTHYRELIKRLLTDFADLVNRHRTSDIEAVCVFDEQRDHYLVLNVGWDKQRRARGTTLYVRIHNGKFWIEDDWTEEGITTDLLEAGVPKDDIVLAFQHPDMRKFTDFAVA